jgi:hypothetical protein
MLSVLLFCAILGLERHSTPFDNHDCGHGGHAGMFRILKNTNTNVYSKG